MFEWHRERRIKGKTTVEVVYGITSLSTDEADAAKLLAFIRDHWKFENQLHYVRDVTWGEDACQVRSGSAPQVMAAMGNTIVYLLAGVDADGCPEAIEVLQLDPAQAMKLIGVPQCD